MEELSYPLTIKQLLTEKYLDYSLKDSHEKDMLLMRKYAHIIDKGLHRRDIEPGHS